MGTGGAVRVCGGGTPQHKMLEEYFGHNKQQADLFSGGMSEDEPALGLLSACGGKNPVSSDLRIMSHLFELGLKGF